MGIGRNWTKQEEQYLEDNWGLLSIGTLSKNLNRSNNAIKVRVTRLNLGAFLDQGEYVTWNQFLKAIGKGISGTGYKNISWIKNRKFPIKTKKVDRCSFKVVYLDEFWKWADKNRSFIDWSLFEENILGKEPDWVKALRKVQYKKRILYKQTPWTKSEDDYLRMLVESYKYSWREISEKIARTEGAVQRRLCDLKIKARPIKAENHNSWTSEDLEKLTEFIQNRVPYEFMAGRLNRSVKAIRGLVYRTYITENIDKAAEIMGTGKFGDNRPSRPITHKTINSEERMSVKRDMTRFVLLLKGEICKHYESNDYWQREICRHWNNGCEASEISCDDCTSFARIRPQYCKRCGVTFFEREENIFCLRCRVQRKKQAQRKYMVMNGKRVYRFNDTK